MALKLPVSFPIFAPPSPQNTLPCPYPPARRPTEIRFSQWINAKSEKFSEQHRSQKEIGDDIRRNRRFDSADTSIGRNYNENFRSQGTPSSSSIPWKKSKYSKRKTSKNLIPPRINPIEKGANVTLSDDGISYVIDGAPFEFKYSYTETPKVKPLKLREPYAPFGPTTLHRPWTGCAPLPPSQKKLKEFDSFVLPPPNKKGVKPVQKPGPFLPGSGPRYVKSREEILGEPLKVEEVRELIKSCLKSERQLNMGRDGLTHNMLDNIHAHWKRRRVCKIKCKGVCTVDMDNVCKQLEERTGGKVIYRRGGVLYLFRGRNYNYKNRPRFPLMLWKPAAPVYPRLIERTPEGLTLEEATEMRRKGRELVPICKLAKNGVYSDLVSNVREAFEVCELVRIDCQGIKGSDYHKIGAKLKDLVPCVLISFEGEHILIWRGRDWKSPLPRPEINSHLQEESNDDSITSVNYSELGVPEASTLTVSNTSVEIDEQYAVIDENSVSIKTNEVSFSDDEPKGLETSYGGDTDFADAGLEAMSDNLEIEKILDVTASTNKEPAAQPLESATITAMAKNMQGTTKVSLLLKQAVESGSAIVLDDHTLDADKIFERAVAFAQSAPRGPVFSCQPRKTAINNSEKQETGDSEVKKFTPVSRSRGNDKQNSQTQRRKDTEERYLDAVPKGTLRVDELAKLLA